MPTAAQQASAPIVAADAAEEKAAGEMVVTGSRIVRDGSSAPVPTTVVTMEDIIQRNPVNIADYVNQLPAIGQGQSPRATTLFANANGGANQINARGLGINRTLVLLDGRSVRWGLLFRSGAMANLTPADFATLAGRGIRTVCDFRDVRERTSAPVNWPAGKAPVVLADDYQNDMSAIARLFGPTLPSGEQARAAMTSTYPQILKQFNGQYRRMFGELLAGRAPLAFNCSAGKDRTGVAAALLLTALGVGRQDVIGDYLLSNRYFDPGKLTGGNDPQSAMFRLVPPEALQAIMGVDRAYIEAVFAVMDAHKGGVDGYLADELGLNLTERRDLVRLYTER
jgi:protein-tyrosine phosphatase